MNNKRGQVTIFIIIAIVIVALTALVYLIAPSLGISFSSSENPKEFINTCLEEDLYLTAQKISMQGGELEPEHYLEYENTPITYLVYSSQYGQPGTLKYPLLRQQIKQEIINELNPIIQNCYSSMKTSYEEKGYSVEMNSGQPNIKILPGQIFLETNYTVYLTKDERRKYENFNVVVNNNLYELLNIVINMIEFASNPNYCGIEPNLYMNVYPEIKVEEPILSNEEDSHISIVTYRKSGDKFQFAWRSCAFAPGY